MHAKVLDYVVYASRWEWRSERIVHPTWAQIEAAVRRLDKFRYPFLHLWPTVDEAKHQLDEGCEWFDVIGGNGEYWFSATIGDQLYRRYFNPEGAEEDVELWSSDQGFYAPDYEVCRDVDTVLRAARYYAESGGYDPSITWRGERPPKPKAEKETTLCPYCGKPLRSPKARQCRHCHTDWHDPDLIRKLG